MKIIDFPKAAQSSKPPSRHAVRISQPQVAHSQMSLGPWEFTCPKCSAPTKFECHNMIFRVMDFYCSSCGTLHRVTNPAFTPTAPTQRK